MKPVYLLALIATACGGDFSTAPSDGRSAPVDDGAAPGLAPPTATPRADATPELPRDDGGHAPSAPSHVDSAAADAQPRARDAAPTTRTIDAGPVPVPTVPHASDAAPVPVPAENPCLHGLCCSGNPCLSACPATSGGGCCLGTPPTECGCLFAARRCIGSVCGTTFECK